MASRKPGRAELQREVHRLRQSLKVPAVAVGIIDGERDLVAVSGVTSLDNPLPVNDTTLFMVGSTTKTFTATALMRLVEEGKVSLDDAVLKYLPKFRLKDLAATRALTVRNLMTHTGGWDGDIDLDTGWGDDALGKFVDALKTQPQLVPVGQHFSYNNAGFAVAGHIIATVTGKTYEAAVSELVFKPLGMHNSFLSPTEMMTRRFAVGHVHGKKPEVAHTLGISRSIAPAGSIASSVRDQLIYARFHLGDGRNAAGKRVLKAKTMKLMQSSLFSAVGLAGSVGISWLIGEVGGVRTVAHGGNVSNLQISSFLMVPSRKFAVTVLTNSGAGGALGAQVEEWVLDRYLGLRRELPPLLDSTRIDLKQYQGEYAAKLSTINVVANDGHLQVTSRWTFTENDVPEEDREFIRKLLAAKPVPIKARLTAKDTMVVVDGPGKGAFGQFVRDKPGGKIGWLRWGGRLNTLKRA